jgi:drug/metabolite transporter (DMT)-like permease
MRTALRPIVFSVLALIGFAANSLLCRRALAPGSSIDPITFTSVRLLSGAATLLTISLLTKHSNSGRGSWASALALFGYAAAFSAAYVRIGASVGALLLFGAVQATMLFWAIYRGERLHALQWLGFLLAISGLVLLTLPGSRAPDTVGAALMLAAGIAWGIYSLRGRRTSNPLRATADNFLRTVPMTLALSALCFRMARVSAPGLALAIASGALASGVGYSLWYAALPHLTAARAAAIQLSVPVVAAVAAVAILGEHLSLRVMISGAIILSGIALAITKKP